MIAANILLGAICFVLSFSAQASQQQELDSLRKRISTLQHDFEKTNESKSEAADALRESESNISTCNRKINELAQQQNIANKALAQLQQQSLQLENEMAYEQTLLSKLLYQQYLGGKQEYLKLLLNNHDPNLIAREFTYYEYITRNRATWLKSLRDKLAKIQALSQLELQKNKEIAALQSEEHLQKQNLEAEKLTRQRTLDKFAKQLSQQKSEIGRLQHDENRLSQLLEKITKIISSPASAEQSRSAKLPDSSFDGKLFATLKGKLALPVKGKIVNKFGTPRPESTVIWKGFFVRASPDLPVKSVAAGRVVYADWLRGFGNLIIVDHGNGYMSLYGNNETLFKQVGETLHGGETIASVGKSGGNDESGLYFELRHEGTPLDPTKWIAR